MFQKQTYEILLKEGGMTHKESIIIGGEAAMTYDVPMCTIRVYFEGFSSVLAEVSTDGGSVSSVNYAKNSAEFIVFQGCPYHVKLTHKGVTYWYKNVDCRGKTLVELGKGATTTVTVTFPGVRASKVTLTSASGKNTFAAWISNSAKLAVPSGIYSIQVENGPMVHTAKDLYVLGDAITYDVPMTRLKVTYPGISMSYVKAYIGGSEVANADWSANEATLSLFRGTVCDLTVSKGAMTYGANGLEMNAEEITHAVPLVTLTVKCPGAINHARALIGDSEVALASWKTNTAKLVLFKGTVCDLAVSRGSMTHRKEGLAVMEDMEYVVPFTRLTVEFKGATGVSVEIAQDGARIDGVSSADDSAVFTVFGGADYSVSAVRGKDAHRGAVNCPGDKPEVTYVVPLADIGLGPASKSPTAVINRLISIVVQAVNTCLPASQAKPIANLLTSLLRF